MTSFNAEVSAQLRCYVYRLIDPMNGETFYVGRGRGNRVFDHANGVTIDENDGLEDTKLERIRLIKDKGHDVIHIIHRHGLSDEAVKEVEASLIDVFTGLTNRIGGQGSSSFGPSNAIDLIRRYSLAEAQRDQDHKLIVIKIADATVVERGNRLEATRSAWRASLSRANSCDFALSVTNGIIRDVYAVKGKWASIEERGGRIAFAMDGATNVPVEVKSRYIDKRMPNQDRGAQNPISYWDF